MTRARVLILLLAVTAAAFPLWRIWHGAATPVAAHEPPPPVVVSDIVVRPQSWQSRMEAYGQVRAAQGAELSAPVSGIVDEIDFRSGDDVKPDTVVLRLRLYDEPAKLQQLQAEVSLYSANLTRDQKQFTAQAISRATLDLDTANLRSFEAQVTQQQQQINEKIVRAPFGGRLGIRLVDPGQYLAAGTAITTLQALDTVFIDFSVPQQQADNINPGVALDVTTDAFPGRVFHARVLARDNRVDPQSRMVAARAGLDNADRALLPGMFVVAHLMEGAARSVLAVPQAAISFNPYGDFVYVLTPKPGSPGVLVARSRVLSLGEKRGDRIVVTAGLHAGDTVVTAGHFKLRDGAAVRIDNRVQPGNLLAPQPQDE